MDLEEKAILQFWLLLLKKLCELDGSQKYNELDQIIFDALVWFNKRFAK